MSPSTRPRKSKATEAKTIPSELGYRMPAEWEAHAATWLAWPHYHGDWPGKFEPIQWVYAEIIRNLSKHERVELIVNNAAAHRQARKALQRADALSDNIRIHRWPTNRVWLRDSGCIFLKQGHVGTAAFGHPTGLTDQQFALHGNREGHEFTRAVKQSKRPGASAPEGLALKFRFNAWAKYSNWRL